MPLPQTIDQVLHRLDLIIEKSIQANNFLGIFAFVYRRTTAQIQQAILDKRFEDNERMEKFDVVFANRYIEAYESFKNQETISQSWQTAFLAKDKSLTILQHLIIGMNAHISFDLGLAAETIAPKEALDDLKEDFMIVNQILQEIIEEMQNRISQVSQLMFLLDWIGAKNDEQVIYFGIKNAKQFAWKFAMGLSALDGGAKNLLIEQTDKTVAHVNQLVQNPSSRILKFVLWLVQTFEEKEVRKIILKLKN